MSSEVASDTIRWRSEMLCTTCAVRSLLLSAPQEIIDFLLSLPSSRGGSSTMRGCRAEECVVYV